MAKEKHHKPKPKHRNAARRAPRASVEPEGDHHVEVAVSNVVLLCRDQLFGKPNNCSLRDFTVLEDADLRTGVAFRNR